MNTKRLLSAMAGLAALVLAGCTPTTDLSTSAYSTAGLATTGSSPNARLALLATPEFQARNWTFGGLAVSVPRTLSVSEAHGITPRADIVWREDPMGDRYTQVEAIMREGLEPILARMPEAAPGSVPVQVFVEVTRFHALTERARYTTGGQHEIEFVYTVRHAETGQVLSPPQPVDLTFRAFGGREAVAAEQQGITQRVRITGRLAQWVAETFPTYGPPAAI